MFEYIEKTVNLSFCIQKIFLPVLQKKVSVSIDKQNVESILNILSKRSGIEVQHQRPSDHNYQSYGRSTSTGKKKIKITGQVLDENGEGIPGANIVIKGNSTLGTVTNVEGNFYINGSGK